MEMTLIFISSSDVSLISKLSFFIHLQVSRRHLYLNLNEMISSLFVSNVLLLWYQPLVNGCPDTTIYRVAKEESMQSF